MAFCFIKHQTCKLLFLRSLGIQSRVMAKTEAKHSMFGGRVGRARPRRWDEELAARYVGAWLVSKPMAACGMQLLKRL